jgi:hypothetical protein
MVASECVEPKRHSKPPSRTRKIPLGYHAGKGACCRHAVVTAILFSPPCHHHHHISTRHLTAQTKLRPDQPSGHTACRPQTSPAPIHSFVSVTDLLIHLLLAMERGLYTPFPPNCTRTRSSTLSPRCPPIQRHQRRNSHHPYHPPFLNTYHLTAHHHTIPADDTTACIGPSLQHTINLDLWRPKRAGYKPSQLRCLDDDRPEYGCPKRFEGLAASINGLSFGYHVVRGACCQCRMLSPADSSHLFTPPPPPPPPHIPPPSFLRRPNKTSPSTQPKPAIQSPPRSPPLICICFE